MGCGSVLDAAQPQIPTALAECGVTCAGGPERPPGKWFPSRKFSGWHRLRLFAGMAATDTNVRSITAPEELGLDTRISFRETVARELDGMADGARLVIDLSQTRKVDSAGLSALMLVHRHASGRNQRLILRAPSEELRFLLALTLMTDLFEIDPARA